MTTTKTEVTLRPVDRALIAAGPAKRQRLIEALAKKNNQTRDSLIVAAGYSLKDKIDPTLRCLIAGKVITRNTGERPYIYTLVKKGDAAKLAADNYAEFPFVGQQFQYDAATSLNVTKLIPSKAKRNAAVKALIGGTALIVATPNYSHRLPKLTKAQKQARKAAKA